MLLEPVVPSCSPIPYYKQYQHPREARFWGWVRNNSKATQELSHVRKIRRHITDMNKINVDRSSEIMQLTWTILAINVNDTAVRYSAVSRRNFLWNLVWEWVMKISEIMQWIIYQCTIAMLTSLDRNSVQSTHYTLFNSHVSDELNTNANFINATDMCVLRR